MAISQRFDPKDVEDKWYRHWESKGYFHSEPDEREPFTIVIPPPNVTGVLHMGHMLNNTIQDILIRRARLDGKNACWVPGTDHASIATEAKVVKMLREKGIKKSDLTRDQFLEYAFKWKDEYGGIILSQLKKLGASCDWERTAFTMDEERSQMVIQAFVDLYNRGKLYRQLRMVNWDPEAQTVLSNEEVIHNEEQSKIYHLRYKVVGKTDEWVTIATTRPETILGDSAVAVHPEDDRYAGLKDTKVIVPLVNREIPIIFDDYVEREFGTGALKVTPAHDVNDYEIGKRHNLEVIDVLNDNGTISEAGQLYIGMDRFATRKQIVKDLEESGHLVEVKDYPHSVGRSERTNAVVEPKLSLQWYVDMPSIAQPALDAVESGEIKFFPKNQENLYKHWLNNIRDWCISRQLWWGHRIPVWYYKDELFVAATEEQALALAKEKHPDISLADLKQDEDVLDTWFSSWLWPFSVFNGFENEELDYYYPTSVLVTGWDIIFLWVARMVMAGYEWKSERPFEHVYFTGMVRDQKRRKMSKSLGNSPDALKLIEDYGADGVRFGMMSCSPAGGDLLFDEKLCEQGRNFCNKIWNALRLIDGWETDENIPYTPENTTSVEWITQRFSKTLEETNGLFQEYRLSEAMMTTYSFVWGDFCSWYLEMIKPPYGEKINPTLKQEAKDLFSQICIALHPYMPFISEEIWHMLEERKEGNDCMMMTYPVVGEVDELLLENVEKIKTIISGVREIRNKKGLKKSALLDFIAIDSKTAQELLSHEGLKSILNKLGVLGSITVVDEEPINAMTFVAGTDKYGIVLEEEIDVASELETLEKDLAYQKGFVASIEKKLSNERFVNNAPEQVVANERNKLADGMERIKMIEESIAKYTQG